MREPRETSPLANLECPPVSEEDRARARLTVCHNATDGADAAELLAMLGLLDEPEQPARCAGCKRIFGDKGREDTVPHRQNGLCASCLARRYVGADAVDGDEVRAYIAELRRCGLSIRAIAEHAGIPQGTLHGILYARWSRKEPCAVVARATADRIMSVTVTASAEAS